MHEELLIIIWVMALNVRARSVCFHSQALQ